MENEKKVTFEDFVDFVNKTSEEKKQAINTDLYNEISSCVDQAIKSQHNKEWSLFIKTFEDLQEIASRCNIDEVTEILLYERIYSNTSKDYCELFTDIVIRDLFGKIRNENFQYIETMILQKDDNRSEQSLVIYIKIAKMHGEHQLKVLNFIERNHQAFSQNQKVLCCMLFDEILSHSPQALRIKKLLNVKEYTLSYGGDDLAENNQTNHSSNKKWWKFWK